MACSTPPCGNGFVLSVAQAQLDFWSTINVHRLDAALYFLGIRPKDLPDKEPHFKPRTLIRPTRRKRV
eukprot:SAG22_NODE_185_length_15941_cov_8.668034_8_plen_68_part_00